MWINNKFRFTREHFFCFIILALFFLASLNIIDRYYYCIYIALLFFVFTPARTLRFNFSSFYLLLLGVAILIFNPESREQITNMLKPFTYFVAYTMGISLLKNESSFEECQRYTRYVIYVVAGGTVSHFVLNLVTNIGSLERDTIDFWTNSVMGATGQACLASIGVGVVAAFIFSRVSKKQKLLAILLACVVFIYNLILAGRTLIFLMLIMFVIAFLHKKIEDKTNILNGIIVVVIIAAIVLIIYSRDILGIKSMFEDSNFYFRFFEGRGHNVFEDSRIRYKLMYLEEMPNYLLGGNHIRSLRGVYAHDLFLDTYDEASVFAFIAIVFYIISSLVRMAKIVRNKEILFETRQLVLCVYVAINIQFWLEPILRGMPWLLLSYCMIDGMVAFFLSGANHSSIKESNKKCV